MAQRQPRLIQTDKSPTTYGYIRMCDVAGPAAHGDKELRMDTPLEDRRTIILHYLAIHARAQAFVDVRIRRRLMAVYTYLPLPEKFTPMDANVTVLALIAPRVGNGGYRGKCRRRARFTDVRHA